ncbi:hypothetical protein V8F33_013159 [Rhypophila sp. PSN 637]
MAAEARQRICSILFPSYGPFSSCLLDDPECFLQRTERHRKSWPIISGRISREIQFIPSTTGSQEHVHHIGAPSVDMGQFNQAVCESPAVSHLKRDCMHVVGMYHICPRPYILPLSLWRSKCGRRKGVVKQRTSNAKSSFEQATWLFSLLWMTEQPGHEPFFMGLASSLRFIDVSSLETHFSKISRCFCRMGHFKFPMFLEAEIWQRAATRQLGNHYRARA